ncbi:unnamed protein product [Protopolystoma xenopodis]|uniref:Neurotransmitter-gated ion-channel transmembrane domain-containing protein n=1 Tax=Protopolystoma xenopodis TaxID=117903 RepID=A0A3S5A8Z4_9PLAT|nr:unnamed protein product [Protopolystoma xenopodis]
MSSYPRSADPKSGYLPSSAGSLKRNPAFNAYLLVLPCILLSFLTLVIFWLPPQIPGKMILGMNIFVAFSFLLKILANSTPSASTSVPYLGT